MTPKQMTIALAMLVAACASRPVSLVALPPAGHAVALSSEPTSQTTILLRRVKLPGYLDNYPVMIRRDDGVVVESADSEWAERLSDGVERVLRAALSQRLGAARVLTPGDGRTADAVVTVEFLALDPQRQAIDLDAAWTILCRNNVSRSGRTALQVPLPEATASAVATATTAALAQLADQLAPRANCTPEVPARLPG